MKTTKKAPLAAGVQPTEHPLFTLDSLKAALLQQPSTGDGGVEIESEANTEFFCDVDGSLI